jgi:hypothetical protein
VSIFGKEASATEWHRAVTKSGQPAGLGATCPVCRGGVRYGIGSDGTFEHCGRLDSPPTNWLDLPRKSLGTGALVNTGNFVLTTDLEDDGEPNSNAGHFENEKRFRWV